MTEDNFYRENGDDGLSIASEGYPTEWQTSSYWTQIEQLADAVLRSDDPVNLAYEVDAMLANIASGDEEPFDAQPWDVESFWDLVESISDNAIAESGPTIESPKVPPLQTSPPKRPQRWYRRHRRHSTRSGRISQQTPKSAKGCANQLEAKPVPEKRRGTARILGYAQTTFIGLTVFALAALMATQCVVAAQTSAGEPGETASGDIQWYSLQYSNQNVDAQERTPFVGNPSVLVLNEPRRTSQGLPKPLMLVVYDTTKCGSAELRLTPKFEGAGINPSLGENFTSSCFKSETFDTSGPEVPMLPSSDGSELGNLIGRDQPGRSSLNIGRLSLSNIDEDNLNMRISDYEIHINYWTSNDSISTTSVDLTPVEPQIETGSWIRSIRPIGSAEVMLGTVLFSTGAATSAISMRTLIRKVQMQVPWTRPT